MPSLVSGLEYDVFISYRQNDNRSGWVTEFVRQLKEELAATIKEPVSVYFDADSHDGLLETHDVDKSLTDKLRCLIFIPILSQTYVDPKGFAWKNEFCVFNKLAQQDLLGRDIRLRNGNVASRILAVRIHELDADDARSIESETSTALRSVDFIFHSAGVNRPLVASDKREDHEKKILYRDQVNKVANAIKEIVLATKGGVQTVSPPESASQVNGSSRRKAILAALLIVLIGTIGVLYFNRRSSGSGSGQTNRSIAVLPFADLSPNHDQEYFGIGMMDEILNHLTKIGELSPVSRTSSMMYKNSNKTLKEIAAELGVTNILEGSIQKWGNKVKISVNLIDAARDHALWTNSYERELNDLFQIQGEIAQNVAAVLSASVGPDVKKRIAQAPTVNQEAYDLYLKAHAKLFTDAEVIPELERVIALDSGFSRAYSDLATRLILLTGYNSNQNIEELSTKALAYANKALALDPNNDGAYTVLIPYELFVRWNPKGAEEALKKIIALNPSRSDIGHNWYMILCAQGRFKEAEDKSRLVFQRDKNSPGNWIGYANSLFYAGHPKQAVDILSAANGMFETKYLYSDDQVLIELAQLNLFVGNFTAAIHAFEPLSQHSPYPLNLGYLACAYANTGHSDKARAILEKLHARTSQTPNGSPAYFSAAVHTALGQYDQAIEWLNKSYANHEVELFWIKVVPIFDPLRKDPRFLELVRKVGFTD